MALDTSRAVTNLRGLTAKFDNSVKAARLFYPTLSTIVPSTGADEEYGMLGRVASVREWLGERDWKELRAAKFTIVNRDWEISHRIAKNDISDDRLNVYGPMMEQMGRRAAKHPDKLLYDLINNAESETSFDGQFFFDTDHLWGDSGQQDNDLTKSVSDSSAITASEFKLAYNAATKAIMEFKDDQGEFLNDDIFDERLQLVVLLNATLLQVAHDALSVRTVSTGGENFVITQPTIVASASYTSTTAFDIYKIDEPLKPYVFQAREPLSRQMKNQDDLEWKDVKFMTKARYNMGYGAWWTAVRTTFS